MQNEAEKLGRQITNDKVRNINNFLCVVSSLKSFFNVVVGRVVRNFTHSGEVLGILRSWFKVGEDEIPGKIS